MQRRSNVATGIVFILVMVLHALTVSTAHGQAFSIAQARLQPLGTVVNVQGWVTVLPGTFQSFSFDCGFAIQDNSAGIYVSIPTPQPPQLPCSSFPLFQQKVQVTGILQDSFGLLILSTYLDNVTALSSFKLIAPQEFNTCQIGEDTEGLLIRVGGTVTAVTVQDCPPSKQLTQTICDDMPYGYRVFIIDDANPPCNGPGPSRLQVFIALGAGIIPDYNQVFNLGNYIEVTGFSGQFDDHYEVNPRFKTDINPAP
jgi:hypothetical protein